MGFLTHFSLLCCRAGPAPWLIYMEMEVPACVRPVNPPVPPPFCVGFVYGCTALCDESCVWRRYVTACVYAADHCLSWAFSVSDRFCAVGAIRCGETLGHLMRPVLHMMGFDSNAAGAVLITGLLGGFAPAAVAAPEQVRTGRLSPRQASLSIASLCMLWSFFVILTVGERFWAAVHWGYGFIYHSCWQAILLRHCFTDLWARYRETCSVQKNPLP